MKISALLNVHSKPDIVLDTIDSIKTYLTNDILVLIDGASSEFDNLAMPVSKMKGLVHNVNKSPYKNIALGLMNLQAMFPDSEWFCYTEYDCLFVSDRIITNLKYASEKDIWMLGNDGHVDDISLPIIEAIVKGKFNGSYYLLGACQFFSKKFMDKLVEINFFEKLLAMTSSYNNGFFPLYQGYDISEHMYPTIARYFGGNIGVFATYDYVTKKWHGSYENFPIRWKPDIDPETENFSNASIFHPIKEYSSPIREQQRKIRKNVNGTAKNLWVSA